MHETPIPVFIGCDWGSSNFRLALLTGDCRVLSTHEDGGGILTLRQGGADTGGLVRHLRDGLASLAGACGFDLSGLPVVISGMAGSTLGIMEVPYLPLPFGPDDGGMKRVDAGPLPGITQRVYIIPGVCGPDDVMRGEETEALGLMEYPGTEDVLMVLPGTHSKHLLIRQRRVCDLRTYMTGEMFQVISSDTILARAVEDPKSDPFDDHGLDCFMDGLRMSGSSDLLHALFTLRSRVLLEHVKVRGNIHRLSGLLIGSELRTLSLEPGYRLVVGGAGLLHECYRIAITSLFGGDRMVDIPEATRRLAVWKGQRRMLSISGDR